VKNTLQHTNTISHLTHPKLSEQDLDLLRSLRAGDEAAFVSLVEQYHSSLLRMAMIYVKTRDAAEGIVQETYCRPEGFGWL
jgi:hypothetical protein